MSALLDEVRTGRAEAVPGLVKPLTAAERRTELAALKALRAELRGWEWGRWRERRSIGCALVVAGAGCLTGAAATAAWIGARDLRESFTLPHGLLLDVLADRDPGWLGDVAHRLAGRASTATLDYRLIAGMVRLAGCQVPATDAFVHGWAEATPSHGRLLPALRADPDVRIMVPRLFETAELPGPLGWQNDPDDPHHWPSVLTVLAEEGVVERRVLVDAAVARLLRGGRPGELTFFLRLLHRLTLTAEEERERTADWIGMAADGPSAVAGHAQGVLGRLALSGALPARSLADMSASVLFRPEKKLVRAQLVLLGKVLRADRGAAGELLPVVAEAFGHEDTGVQERALKLVARHLPALDGDPRSEVVRAAALLSPVHRARAGEVFGELPVADEAPYEEILPPAPEPVRLAPAPVDLAELVEEVAALIVSPDGGMPAFERALDGLVRHTYRDRVALVRALRPALAGCWWLEDNEPGNRDRWFARNACRLEVVAAALLDRISTRTLQTHTREKTVGSCAHSALIGVIDARLREAAYLVHAAPPPFLLATPTWETGALDADVLVERLREYQRLGAVPGPTDFAQALLRVDRGGDPATAGAAAALGTPEGDRLAAWLTADGAPVPALRPMAEPPRPARAGDAVAAAWPAQALTGKAAAFAAGLRPWRKEKEKQERTERAELLAVRREFPVAFAWLGHPGARAVPRCYHWDGLRDAHWTAVLPQDREALAARLLTEAMSSARDDQRGGTWWLPLLAEGGGRAGRCLHRGVAYGLGARHAQDRLSAVDALLVLAARGELAGPMLGEELAALVISGDVKINRLADAARTAAATGAYGTVASVLLPALPALLAPDPVAPESADRESADREASVASASVAPGASRSVSARPGLGEILSVAADCVERRGGAEEIPGLPELAGRGGTSQVITQAARLLAAIRQGSDHSTPKMAEDGPKRNRSNLNPSVTNRS
ncbi:DUF6493 family protein [Streptomyces sp. JV176]|uniref:DUF7824 domain-containing protein n=1 Tax=Streptomyces sp. JV176 TaxID=858630 RepID=UPI002E78CDDB|nr:DUF6493 family protein [Streptomyces sp. JV176]MEE1798898.1 DUF6493 family protein [Streptomyces sp. JV176]